MSTLHFSLPMVAELNDDTIIVQWAKTMLDDKALGKLIAKSIADIPEFQTLMADINSGGTWCVATVDTEALV